MKKSAFDVWIESRDGLASMQWPISDPIYLKNRLYWAFHAGVKDNEEVKRLQSTIEWYEEQLKKLKSENKHMTKLLEQYADNESNQPGTGG